MLIKAIVRSILVLLCLGAIAEVCVNGLDARASSSSDSEAPPMQDGPGI
jgi:hypothetical protein